MKNLFAFIFFFSVLTFSVSAQWTNDPLVNTVVNNMSGSQATPLIAYDASGNFYIGFFSSESGNYNMRLQYFDFEGIAQWAPGGILVSNHPQNTSLTIWDLITDNTGNCILVFQDLRNGSGNMYTYAISPSGTFLWGADGIALTNSSEWVYLPSLTVTSTNNIIVAWQKPGPPYKKVVMQKITPAGTVSWGSTGIEYQSGSYSYTAPRLLGVENDQFLMAFYKETGNFPALTRHIYVQKFNASGSAVWSSDVLVSNSNGISPYAYFPTVASDGANGIVVAWTDDRNSDNNINAAVNRVLSNGTSTWPANGTQVSTQSSNSHQNPSILGINSNNEVLVTWSKKTGNQDQTAISGQKFSANGVAQWTASGIDFVPMSSGVSGSTGGAVFNETDAMIVYEEYGSTSAYSSIKALAVNNSGSMIWTPTTTLMAGRNTSKIHIALSGLYDEQLIAVWEEGGNDDIYMQNIFTDGSIGVPPISHDATLSDLRVNGTTVPGFNPEVYTYSYPIPTGDPLPTISATLSTPLASMVITQASTVPGSATVVVTAEDETTQHTYTVNFYVAGVIATLADLTVDNVTIPGFSPTDFNYDYTVPTGNPIPVVDATATDIHANVEINQAVDLPGVATVEVTSEDGQHTNIYTVNFLYTPSAVATLDDILLNGASLDGFSSNVYVYDVEVVYDDPAPYAMGVPTDPNAAVAETQCSEIPGDAILVVTAEDGTTQLTYTIHFTYTNYDTSLIDLTVDGLTISGFDPNTLSYQYLVENINPIPVVDGIANNPLATLTIIQATEIPGSAYLTVLAEDGLHESTYSVYFYTISNIATLLDLKVDGVTVEGFDPAINYYAVNVTVGSPVPVITASTTDPEATMEITQAPAVPGDGFVVVTAQDGVTQFTYTVHFDLVIGIQSEKETTISISPNPVTDHIQLMDVTGKVRIEIMNLLGKCVLNAEYSDNPKIDMSFLGQGIYFARISQQNGKIISIKFIKK